MSNVSVIKIKNTNRRADIDPVGILRLGRFNSPKEKKRFNFIYTYSRK
jgi:hypothetical protein